MPTSSTDFAIQDGQTVVFIGDSITDTGRRGPEFPYGHGYVRKIIDLITAKYPERAITFYNRGISGNVIADLHERWADDAINLKPDWLSVLVGINDLHRRFKDDKVESFPPTYRKLYTECLERAVEQTNARLVLMDPFYISVESSATSARRQVLDLLPKYIRVVHEMAREFGAINVPLHDIFQQQLRHRPADVFCPEPVHPNAAGHLVIAHALLAAVGW